VWTFDGAVASTTVSKSVVFDETGEIPEKDSGFGVSSCKDGVVVIGNRAGGVRGKEAEAHVERDITIREVELKKSSV